MSLIEQNYNLQGLWDIFQASCGKRELLLLYIHKHNSSFGSHQQSINHERTTLTPYTYNVIIGRNTKPWWSGKKKSKKPIVLLHNFTYLSLEFVYIHDLFELKKDLTCRIYCFSLCLNFSFIIGFQFYSIALFQQNNSCIYIQNPKLLVKKES